MYHRYRGMDLCLYSLHECHYKQYPSRAVELLEYLSLIRYAAKYHRGLGLCMTLTHWPETARNRACLTKSLVPLVTSSFWTILDNFDNSTCPGRWDLSSHTQISAIQSNRPEKDAKNRVTLTREFQWKFCPTTHSYFLQKHSRSSNFLQNLFLPKGSLVNAQQKKKRGKKSKRSREERKQKVKDEGARKLARKKSAFCACPNFENCNLT